MPCDQKVHVVKEKWEREKQRREEAERRRREEQERGIPAPAWPKPVKAPAEQGNG